jgi:uncharacterized membrane protein YoaK (UPF0700 family)
MTFALPSWMVLAAGVLLADAAVVFCRHGIKLRSARIVLASTVAALGAGAFALGLLHGPRPVPGLVPWTLLVLAAGVLASSAVAWRLRRLRWRS